MAIVKKERANKFDAAVAEMNEQAEEELEVSKSVVQRIAGDGSDTKLVIDKNGRQRRIKKVEDRKTLPVYIPESLYRKFDNYTTFNGISNNAAICQLIRAYVTEQEQKYGDV